MFVLNKYSWNSKLYLTKSAIAWVSAAEPDLKQNILSERGVNLSVTRFETYDLWNYKKIKRILIIKIIVV